MVYKIAFCVILRQVTRLTVPSCGRRVNDIQWHILKIRRRANHLAAQIDDCREATGLYIFLFNFHTWAYPRGPEVLGSPAEASELWGVEGMGCGESRIIQQMAGRLSVCIRKKHGRLTDALT